MTFGGAGRVLIANFSHLEGRRAFYTEQVEPWAELVELYEYKVADILTGREPRGGRRSMVALRDALLFGELDSALLRRFRQTDRLWREHAVAAAPLPLSSSPEAASGLEDWSAAETPPQDAEGELLGELAVGLWRLRLEDQLGKLAERWRREAGLVTLRALYALSLNLEAGKIAHAVPVEHDRLVSLGNAQVALEMLSGLLGQLLDFRSETLTPVAWGRSMLVELADNPFVGAHRGVSAASRAGERPQIREALGQGFNALVRLLPARLGGSGDDAPTLSHALFAHTPARRLPQPGSGGAESGPGNTGAEHTGTEDSMLALRLAGAGELQWRGLSLGWNNVGGAWQLSVGGAAYPLRQEGREIGVVRIPLDGAELRALILHGYLLLDLEAASHVSLAGLLALGRPVAALLESADAYLHLRLARGVAQWLRDGRVDPASLSPESAAKYATAVPDTLLAFARKGAENLLARLARHGEAGAERAFHEVARQLGCPEERASRLLDVLRRAREEPALAEVHEVRREDEAALVAYRGDPLTVAVAGRALTLRADYRGEVTAVLPGAPALPVRDIQVFTLPQGSVIVARQGLRMAVGYQRPLSAG